MDLQCIDVQISYNYISLRSDDYSMDSSTRAYVVMSFYITVLMIMYNKL